MVAIVLAPAFSIKNPCGNLADGNEVRVAHWVATGS
jgi:hypothetical protein